MEDQHQFILHHRVMEKEMDDQVTIDMVSEGKRRFPELATCSFDKGFHSPKDQNTLTELLERVTLPGKGKPSQKTKAHESSEAFQPVRKNH